MIDEDFARLWLAQQGYRNGQPAVQAFGGRVPAGIAPASTPAPPTRPTEIPTAKRYLRGPLDQDPQNPQARMLARWEYGQGGQPPAITTQPLPPPVAPQTPAPMPLQQPAMAPPDPAQMPAPKPAPPPGQGGLFTNLTPEQRSMLLVSMLGKAAAGFGAGAQRGGIGGGLAAMAGGMAEGMGDYQTMDLRRQAGQMAMTRAQLEEEEIALKREERARFAAMREGMPEEQRKLLDLYAMAPGLATAQMQRDNSRRTQVVDTAEGQKLIDLDTGEEIRRVGAAKDGWTLMTPDEMKAAGLQDGVYQKNARGEIQLVSGSEPEKQAPQLIDIQDPTDPSKSIKWDVTNGRPYVIGGAAAPTGAAPAAAGMPPVVARPVGKRDENPAFDREQGLRKEIEGLAPVKGWRQVAPAVNSAFKTFSTNTRASDLDLVFAVGKTLDPDSVVREGEQVQIAKTGSLPDQIVGYISALNGGGRLPPETRRPLLEMLRTRAGEWNTSAKAEVERYKPIVGQYELKEENVLPHIGDLPKFPWEEPEPRAPASVAPPPAAGGAAPATPPVEAVSRAASLWEKKLNGGGLTRAEEEELARLMQSLPQQNGSPAASSPDLDYFGLQ